MAKFLASFFGILLAFGFAIAAPPDGKGKNQEQTPGPVQVLANGESVGTFLTYDINSYLLVLSGTGYFFHLDWLINPLSDPPQQGELSIQSFYYEDFSCLSPPYVLTSASGGNLTDSKLNTQQGFVFRSGTYPTYNTYYVPAGTSPVQRTFVSFGNPFDCNEGSNGGYFWSAAALPNDPTVTGVPNESFTPPITLGN